jgi:mannose-1-phosphate guanylyltransferase
MQNLYAVIMAGGSGTRFWPASRVGRPKQLLALAGASGEPLIAATVRRILPLCPKERIYIVTAEHLLAATREAAPSVPAANFLSEPSPRNTAPCVGWAANVIRSRDPDAILMVLPSDHHITDEPSFVKTAARAAQFASESDMLVTVGIEPTRPETGYGYIETGDAVADGVLRVARFVEKPDQEQAAAYLSTGRHLWNSGMFFFRAAAIADAIRRHLPELAAGLERIERTGELSAVFRTLPAISIDQGIMEQADRIAVVPGSFGWNDVGSWQAAWELLPKDAMGNVLPAGSIVVEGGGNLVCDLTTGGRRRVAALVGVSDLVVVETDDALLIIPRERAQDVRKAIELLRDRGDDETL